MLTLQTVQNLKYNTNNAYNTYNIKAKKKTLTILLVLPY